MCIICIKPLNVDDFSDEVLSYCWDKNDDGAGFAWWNKDKAAWSARKGFMMYKDFLKAYRSHKFDKTATVIVHFRIGTSGLMDAGNTHPFPVCDDFEKMRETEFDSTFLTFHNGVVGKGEGDFSDTMVHIRDYLFPISPLWEDKRISTDIADTLLTKSSSRWVVCYNNVYHTYGTWHDYEGWRFSNTNYKSWAVVQPTTNRIDSFNLCPDPDYKYLNLMGKLPFGNWSHGMSMGKHGFWKGHMFISWKDYRETLSLVPSTEGKEPPFQLQEIKTKEDFYARYMISYGTKEGKMTVVPNFKVYFMDLRITKKKKEKETLSAKEEAAKKLLMGPDEIMTALVDDDGSLAFTGENSEEFRDEIKDFKMCPSCYDDRIADSPFTVGDSLCLVCGCVFDSTTGEIQTYDIDMHKKFSNGSN